MVIMDLQQLKLYAINGSTLGITTLANIEMGLKIVLLLVTIGYTISKWKEIKSKK
jgi:NADH:ubiquinone oxidoreductase subunit 3 (subunit A)